MVRHRRCFNAARGFVGGAARNQSWAFSLDTVSMPHAALWVVQRGQESTPARAHILFQCRTRLCGWCSYVMAQVLLVAMSFNAARGFVGGAAHEARETVRKVKSGFNAARGFVGGAARKALNAEMARQDGFNAARGFVGGAASSLSALVPLRGKRPFGKSPEI